MNIGGTDISVPTVFYVPNVVVKMAFAMTRTDGI